MKKIGGPILRKRGMFLSIPALVIACFAYTSNDETPGIVLAGIAFLMSFPWNIAAALFIGCITAPIVAWLQFNGFLWLILLMFVALVVGAQINGNLLMDKFFGPDMDESTGKDT